MKIHRTSHLIPLAAILIVGALSLPCQAGGCCGGKSVSLGIGGGGGIGTFKGGAARLPRITAKDEFSITVADKKKYLVGPDVTLIVDGRPAKWDDIKLGMGVLVNGRMVDRGDNAKASIYKASRITARSGDS